MGQYGEYQDKDSEKGRKEPDPGGDQGNGQISGCMVVAPAVALLVAAVALIRRG